MKEHIFTSESVTEGHPDKICDQISDAVLDAILEQDPNGRVACETVTTTGMVMVMGEMESAAMFTVAAALGVRSGACFHVIWNQEREKAGLDQIENDDTGSAVRVAVEALRRLIREDRAKL